MKFNRCLIMFFLAFSLDGIANETEIVTKINQVLPAGMSVKGIKQSQVDGLFVVDIGAVSYTHLTLPTICSV